MAKMYAHHSKSEEYAVQDAPLLDKASLSFGQVASALMARHIGGAVNYVGVAETLSITPSAQAAGLAADSLICAFYFAGIFKLASSIGPDDASITEAAVAAQAGAKSKPQQETGGIQVKGSS